MEEVTKKCELHNTYYTNKCPICEKEDINEKINTLDLLIGTIFSIISISIALIIFAFCVI